jgi:hypothetical protein
MALLLTENLPAGLDGIGKNVKHRHSILPVDASISDTDTVLETSLTFLGNLLVAY